MAMVPISNSGGTTRPISTLPTRCNLTSGANVTGIDAQLAAAGAIAGTVTDSGSKPLEGICVQATTSTVFGGLARTDSNGNYFIVIGKPGTYRIQFVDCNDTPTFAGEWWDNQASAATAQPVTVTLGETVKGVDAALVPGALSTISGKVVNLHGIAMTTACVIAYVPNQYAIFAPVNPDGSYTLAGVPSGTYSLAFLGCNGGIPSPTVADPEVANISYHAVWWNGVTLALDQNNNGGPDPIAQGAHLVTIAPGQTLTDYDWCFGCTAISIATITPDTGALTVAYTTPGLATEAGDTQAVASARASNLTYTATCTSSKGEASDSAGGPSAAITVTGLAPGDYTCIVTAADDRTTVLSSAVSQVVAVPGQAEDPTPATPAAPTPSTPTALSTDNPTASTPAAPTPAAGQANADPAALGLHRLELDPRTCLRFRRSHLLRSRLHGRRSTTPPRTDPVTVRPTPRENASEVCSRDVCLSSCAGSDDVLLVHSRRGNEHDHPWCDPGVARIAPFGADLVDHRTRADRGRCGAVVGRRDGSRSRRQTALLLSLHTVS